jgi:hypothetical protein
MVNIRDTELWHHSRCNQRQQRMSYSEADAVVEDGVTVSVTKVAVVSDDQRPSVSYLNDFT